MNQILRATTLAGYLEPTPNPRRSNTCAFSRKDILGSAQTGTGKTAAFAIPIIQHLFLNQRRDGKKVLEHLVLTPTRELASQIAENFSIYAKYTNINNVVIYGGVKQKNQEIHPI